MIIKADRSHVELLAASAEGVLSDLPNYANVEQDINHTRNMLTLYLGLDGLGCFFKEVDGKVVGLFMGIVAAQWFSPTLEMAEIMFWVRKDYRTTDLAVRLIRSMEEWATGIGAKRLIMASSSGFNTDGVEKFYNFMGYKTNAIQCVKEV
jgi:GNAT superfamily N-acetyltransferase